MVHHANSCHLVEAVPYWLNEIELHLETPGREWGRGLQQEARLEAVSKNKVDSTTLSDVLRQLEEIKPRVEQTLAQLDEEKLALEAPSRNPLHGRRFCHHSQESMAWNGHDIGAGMQKLPKGFHSKSHRHTHSAIYQVFYGSGYSIIINGVRFDWSKGDYFIIPNWAVHEHVALEDTFFFSVNDLPIMEKFDLEQEIPFDHNNGYQEVTGEFKPAILV